MKQYKSNMESDKFFSLRYFSNVIYKYDQCTKFIYSALD